MTTRDILLGAAHDLGLRGSGACEGFGVDSVAIETHNSATSKLSHVVILELRYDLVWKQL